MGLLKRLVTYLRRLPWKVAIAAEIAVLYVRVRLAIRDDDIRAVVTVLRARSTAHRGVHCRARAERLGAAVHRVLSHAPEQSRCLIESLVLTRMLARRDIDSSVIIGVASGGTFAAHAWVEADGRPLLPPLAPTYVPLVRI